MDKYTTIPELKDTCCGCCFWKPSETSLLVCVEGRIINMRRIMREKTGVDCVFNNIIWKRNFT